MSESDTYSSATETAVVDAAEATAAGGEHVQTSSDRASSGRIVPDATRNTTAQKGRSSSSLLTAKRTEELMALRVTNRTGRRSSEKTAGPQGVGTPVTHQTYVTVSSPRHLHI